LQALKFGSTALAGTSGFAGSTTRGAVLLLPLLTFLLLLMAVLQALRARAASRMKTRGVRINRSYPFNDSLRATAAMRRASKIN
jgi:hypothetical protein